MLEATKIKLKSQMLVANAKFPRFENDVSPTSAVVRSHRTKCVFFDFLCDSLDTFDQPTVVILNLKFPRLQFLCLFHAHQTESAR